MSAPSNIPPSMRAYVSTRRGSLLETLTLTTVPTPTLQPGHILIRITHCSLNPSITLVMKLFPNPLSTPRIPELDFAGVVASSNPHHPLGTPVWGVLPLRPSNLLTARGAQGTLAEYVLIPSSYVFSIPPHISPIVSAGLGAAGSTALRFLHAASISPGSAFLIIGASGGVGSFLVQAAKNTVGPSGLVVAVCSSANADLVSSLGADDVIPYDGAEKAEVVLTRKYGERKFDSIIDTVGVQSLYVACPGFLKEGRTFLNMGALPYTGQGMWGVVSFVPDLLANFFWPRMLGGTPRAYRLLTTDPVPELLREVGELVASGVMKPLVDSVWSFEDALKAYERVESHRAKGKVIIEVQKV